MGSTRALLLAGVLALAAGPVAHAADLPPPPVFIPPPPPEPVPYGGWYLRGDVGAGLSFGNIRSSFYDIGTDVPSTGADLNQYIRGFGRDSTSFGDVGFVDVGVGYQFNNWFRMDVTGEVRSAAHFSTQEHYDNSWYVANAVPGQFGKDIYHGSWQSSVFLVNGYVDFGTWYGVTVYGGAGVGAAYVRLASITDTNPGSVLYFNDGTSTVDGLGGGGFSTGKDKFNFAFAGMLGLSYDLTANLKLDVGYRYLNMGSITSNGITCIGGTNVCGGGGVYEKQRLSLQSNDIRVGLRWMINDYVPVPPPPPPVPIITKD